MNRFLLLIGLVYPVRVTQEYIHQLYYVQFSCTVLEEFFLTLLVEYKKLVQGG